MIQVNELRFNSWICDKNGKPAKVNEIKRHPSCERDFAHIVTFQGLGFFGGYIEDLQPISLTPEILEKCGLWNPQGAEYSGCWEVLKNGKISGFTYYLPKQQVMIMQKGNTIGHWIRNKIEHLHQLQNLYFALTGEELMVKL